MEWPRIITCTVILLLQADAVQDCGVCLSGNDWLPFHLHLPCGQCNGWRPSHHLPESPTLDVRVTKGLGAKGYDQVRISVIQRNNATAVSQEILEAFQDQKGASIEPFKLRWTHSSYYTRIMTTSDANKLPSALRPSPIPAQGAGVTGILFGDPCTQDAWVGCQHAERWQTRNTTPALVNLFMDQPDMSFYTLLGDNFYDQTGEITAPFWNSLTAKTKSKILMTVPGNHDFWVQGAPISRVLWRKREDQFGYGLAQWHMMDTISAKGSTNDTAFSAEPLFDYSVDPDASIWPVFAARDHIASPSNFFWYNQMGDVVFVGYSGAHEWDPQSEYFREACEWVSSVQHTTNWVVLLGHWDITNTDYTATGGVTGTPQGLWKMATDSCGVFKDYYAHGRLKYATGHTHCNKPHPHSHPNAKGAGDFSLVDNVTGYAGFLLGGMGMSDGSPTCSELENYGVAVMSTTPGQASGDRFELVFFQVARITSFVNRFNYTAVESCVTDLGWRECALRAPELTEVWLNVTASPWNRSLVESKLNYI